MFARKLTRSTWISGCDAVSAAGAYLAFVVLFAALGLVILDQSMRLFVNILPRNVIANDSNRVILVTKSRKSSERRVRLAAQVRSRTASLQVQASFGDTSRAVPSSVSEVDQKELARRLSVFLGGMSEDTNIRVADAAVPATELTACAGSCDETVPMTQLSDASLTVEEAGLTGVALSSDSGVVFDPAEPEASLLIPVAEIDANKKSRTKFQVASKLRKSGKGSARPLARPDAPAVWSSTSLVSASYNVLSATESPKTRKRKAQTAKMDLFTAYLIGN